MSEAAERETAASGTLPLLRVGVLASIPSAWLERIARDCAASAAVEQVEFVDGRERELTEALTRGRIDVALTLIRPDERRFTAEPVLEEGYRLALPASHPLASTSATPSRPPAATSRLPPRSTSSRSSHDLQIEGAVEEPAHLRAVEVIWS